MSGRVCVERDLSPGHGGIVIDSVPVPFLPAGPYVVRIDIGNGHHDATILLP